MHDADDISIPGRFEKLISSMGAHQAVSSYMNICKNGSKSIKRFHPDAFFAQAIKPPAHHCATLIRRDLWDILGEYDTKLYMSADSERMFKLAMYLRLFGEELKMLDVPLYDYYVRGYSYSRKNAKDFEHQIKVQRSKIKTLWPLVKNCSPENFLQLWDSVFLT